MVPPAERPDTAVPDLSPRALAERLARGEPLCLLDVREPFERDLCRIPAPPDVADLHLPIRRVPDALDALRIEQAGRPIVVYCHHGVRSRMVAEWLAAQGLGGLVNLGGGIDAWSVEVDPTVPRY